MVDHHSLVAVENRHRHLVERMVGVVGGVAGHEEHKDVLVEEAECCVFGTFLGDQIDHRLVEARMERLACHLEQHLQDLRFL